MSHCSKIYYKIINLLLSLLVRSKSLPNSPVMELRLDISRPILYVLPHSSNIDLLILRAQCLKHKLPDPIESLIINDTKLPRFIFIKDNLHIFNCYFSINKFFNLFYDYFNLHIKDPNLDIQVVLTSVMFGRSPGREKNKTSKSLNIFNIIRKIFIMTWFRRDIFVRFSHSISLRRIMTKHNIDKTNSYKLLRIARIYFIRQHLATVGPRLSVRHNLFKKLLTSKAISRAVEDEMRGKKISYKEAQKNAIELMKEIAANFSYEMVRMTDRILGFTWNRLYQGINVHNVEKIRQLAYDGHEIVYVPCHRSHMDYLLISYVLYHHGLAIPHIVAGVNLNFWPAGAIFRRLGAFFIRRTFKYNKLYSIIFREYLSELFNRGYPVEYFLEGSRSRTGRLLDPKTGTLSITIQAMLRSGGIRPITLVPVHIGYEHVMEINTYIKELRGFPKEKESLLNILRGLIKLRNLGQSYVNFGEPLPLINWLNKYVPDWRTSINSIEIIRPNWLNPIVNDIATNLMIRINNAVAANAMNLICTALLASYQLSLSREQLTEQLNCYLDLIHNVPYSKNSTVPSISTSDLIDHAIQMNKFKIEKDIAGDIIILPRKQATLLTYYRNNIIHILVLPSLIATIIIQYKNISRKELIRYISMIYPMLKAEFFLRWNYNELAIELDKLTNELLRQKLIIFNNNKLQINPPRFYTFKLLAESVQDTLQRYTITFWLLNINPYINRNELERESQALARRLSVLHSINAPEFFDKTIFSTLVLTLRDEGYISDNKAEIDKIKKIYRILAKLIALDVRLTIENTNISVSSHNIELKQF